MARLLNYLKTLSIGTCAGLGAYYLGLPLPWMLGSMAVITVLALSQVHLSTPPHLRSIVAPILGVMLGSGVTPNIWTELATWSFSLLFLLPCLLAMSGLSFLIYRKVGKYRVSTAYFAAMPGGLTDMVLVGGSFGGDERRIALAHAVRVLVVVGAIGLFFGLFLGVNSNANVTSTSTAIQALSMFDWLILTLCAVLGVPLGRLLRLPAYMILGPMILSAVVHVTGVVHVGPPTVLVNAAQIALGTLIGCRFKGLIFRDVASDITVGVAAALTMLIVAVVFAIAASTALSMPLSQVFLAFSPGGLAEMSLLAIAMNQQLAYVSLMHILRIAVVVIAAPFIFRYRIGAD